MAKKTDNAQVHELLLQALETERGGITLAAVPALWRTWHEADAVPRNVRIAISAGGRVDVYEIYWNWRY